MYSWKFLTMAHLRVRNIQFLGGVVGFSLCQTPTSIHNDGISSIITSLVEDSPQARPTSISMELKRPCEISIGKNRHCGAQVLQVIKGLLTPVTPCDSHFLLVCIFTWCQFMQGLSYLHELWNKPPVIPHKTQKTSDLSDISRGRSFLNSINFTVFGGYFLGRNHMPQVDDLPSEQLTLGRFEF